MGDLPVPGEWAARSLAVAARLLLVAAALGVVVLLARRLLAGSPHK